MIDTNLKDIDSEDLEDLLLKIEFSFDFKFDDNELVDINTFGEFIDKVTHKIQLEDVNNCTGQQAFYKLRLIISSTLQIDPKSIATDFLLIDILPRKNRRYILKKLEDHLGFKLNILRPPHWVSFSLLIIFIASLIGLFFNWQIGLSGLIFSLFGISLANRFGKELDLKTVGQLAEKMTRENYLQSRRNPDTYNKNEIESVLTDWCSDYFSLDKNKLTREAIFREKQIQEE